MCNAFCKWLKSFTKLELLLSVLEVIFLTTFIASLVFLISHLLECNNQSEEDISSISSTEISTYESTSSVTTSLLITTLLPNEKCTWKPSVVTEAVTHYYWEGEDDKATTTLNKKANVTDSEENIYILDDIYYRLVAALMQTINKEKQFRCMLTVISIYWTITASNCLNGFTGDLDNFLILEGYFEIKEKEHKISDVQIHPNREYRNLAAVKSLDKIELSVSAKLPTVFDYLQTTIGESYILLHLSKSSDLEEPKRLRGVLMWRLPSAKCNLPSSSSFICAGDGSEIRDHSSEVRGSVLVRGAEVCGVAEGGGNRANVMKFVNTAAVEDWLSGLIHID